MPTGIKREPPSPGERVGRLVVVRTERDHERKQTRIVATCDCGKETSLLFRSWGGTKSCGCLQRERASETFRKHGKSDTRLNRVWRGMRERCSNPQRAEYLNYGGRGIRVCEEWNDFSKFAEWSENNGYSSELDIDRIDNDGPYSPENCHWVTRSENLRNTRRTRKVTALGETKAMADWAEDPRCLVSYETLSSRLLRDWEPEDAILLPKGRWNPKRRTS